MMKYINLCKTNRENLRRSSHGLNRHYSSLFRTSLAKRLKDTTTSATKGWSTRKVQEEATREAREKLVSKVEPLVRERLKKEFPREFEASWFVDASAFGGRQAPPLTLASFKTLLALNGFQRVVKPSGNNHRLYLAEGVVATPPRKLSFNAMAIPFASGYQEFARGMEMDNVGVFGDVHNHFVTSTQSNKKIDRLFAQPLEHSYLHPGDRIVKVENETDSQPVAKPADFPEFVQEDITVYRVAENSAARVIDSTYSRWTEWTQRRFVRPLKDAKYRTRIAIKSANAMRAKFHEVMEKSLAERVFEELSNFLKRRSETKRLENSNIVVASESPVPAERVNNTPISDEVGKISNNNKEPKSQAIAKSETEATPAKKMDASEESKEEKSIEVVEEKKEIDPLETLVVISSRSIIPVGGSSKANSASEPIATGEGDEIVHSVSLYRRMTPSTRILALPDYYVLRHSSASTLVSVSLVVFGALPLAYRSYIFSINYEWLVGSGLIATSVIATITYGIVSWRWRARTSQSKTVHEALGARVGARDEAALLLLKEGAVRSLVGKILDAKIPTSEEPPTNLDAGNALVDPMQWAIDFGVIEESKSSASKDDKQTQN